MSDKYFKTEARTIIAKRIQAFCTYDRYTRINEDDLLRVPNERSFYQDEELIWVINELKKEGYIYSHREVDDESGDKFYVIRLCPTEEQLNEMENMPQEINYKKARADLLFAMCILSLLTSFLSLLIAVGSSGNHSP